MNPRVSTAEAPARNPIARSLALAVLAVALVGAAIMGAVVFAVLLGLFAVGYLVSLAHAWWRLFRVRRSLQFLVGRSDLLGQPRGHAAERGGDRGPRL